MGGRAPAVLDPANFADAEDIQDTNVHTFTTGVDTNLIPMLDKVCIIELVKVGNPDDLSFTPEVSLDGVTWVQLGSPTSYIATIDDSFSFTTHCRKLRVKCSTTTADGSNYWTISLTVAGKT